MQIADWQSGFSVLGENQYGVLLITIAASYVEIH